MFKKVKKEKIEKKEVEEEMQEELKPVASELDDKKERKQFLVELMETLTVNRFPIDSAIMNEFDQTVLRIKEIEEKI